MFATGSPLAPVAPQEPPSHSLSDEQESATLPEDIESSGEVAVDNGNIAVRKKT